MRAWLQHDVDVVMVRTQISLDPELQRRAKRRAEELGISLAELTRRALARELDDRRSDGRMEISAIFDLGTSAGSDIAGEKDRYLAEASWNEYLRKTGRSSRSSIGPASR